MPEFVQAISCFTLANKVWCNLNIVYFVTNDITIMHLQDALSNLKMKEGDSVALHVVTLKGL